MDIGNPVKTIMHYLLIGGMTCLGYQDGFSLVSILVYVMHSKTEPTVNHDVRL